MDGGIHMDRNTTKEGLLCWPCPLPFNLTNAYIVLFMAESSPKLMEGMEDMDIQIDTSLNIVL